MSGTQQKAPSGAPAPGGSGSGSGADSALQEMIRKRPPRPTCGEPAQPTQRQAPEENTR